MGRFVFSWLDFFPLFFFPYVVCVVHVCVWMHVHMSAGTHANACGARGWHLVSPWMVSTLFIEAGSLTEPRLVGQLAPVSGQALYRLSHSILPHPTHPTPPTPPHPTQPIWPNCFYSGFLSLQSGVTCLFVCFCFFLGLVNVNFKFAILLPQPSKYWRNQLLINWFYLPPLLLHPDLPYNLPS